MNEYIDVDAIRKTLYESYRLNVDLKRPGFAAGIKHAADLVSNFDRAEVVPVVHASWLNVKGKSPKFLIGECSLCRRVSHLRSKYCPNCGASMDRKE